MDLQVFKVWLERRWLSSHPAAVWDAVEEEEREWRMNKGRKKKIKQRKFVEEKRMELKVQN